MSGLFLRGGDALEDGIRVGRDQGAEGEEQLLVEVTVRDRHEMLDPAVGDVDALFRAGRYVSLRSQWPRRRHPQHRAPRLVQDTPEPSEAVLWADGPGGLSGVYGGRS